MSITKLKQIKKKTDGNERLFKLMDIAREDAHRHDRHAMFYYYFTWVLIAITGVALAYPKSVTSFSLFGVSAPEQPVLLALLAPVIGGTMYMQRSSQVLRNVSIREFECILRVLYPELNSEVSMVAYRPGDFMKVERVMNHYLESEYEKRSVIINSGLAVLFQRVSLSCVMVWLFFTMVTKLGWQHPLLYLSWAATAIIARKANLVWSFAKRWPMIPIDGCECESCTALRMKGAT